MFARLQQLSAARWPLLPLFAVWLTTVLWLAAGHVFFRDEVRALSIATSGATVGDMLAVLHGEGHPALWYLLLRGGHALIGNIALPVIAILVAANAAALLLWRAPFGWPVKALILFSKFMLFEYAVMARNYGISVLLMFAFAALYRRWRDRGIGLGLILLLLANTNVHSALIAAALMVFWLLDTAGESGWRWTRELRLVAGNAVLPLIGTGLCAATVWPPFNDAASTLMTSDPPVLLGAVLVPGQNFIYLTPVDKLLPLVGWWPLHFGVTLLLVLAALELAPRPALLLAAIGSLLALSLFFTVVYAGGYRHQALWLVLLITLYWLARDHRMPLPVVAGAQRRLPVGTGAALVLLGLQVWLGMIAAHESLARPQSAARALGQLIDATPALRRATIIADPDFMIEALPYYLDNPLYQLRQPRSVPIVHFTAHAKLGLTLGEVLDSAQRLHRERGTPVIILLRHPVDPAAKPATIKEGYNWTFSSDPASAARFAAATTRLATLGPVSGDEDYTVYCLRE